MNRPTISADDFVFIQRLVLRESAVVLAPGKEYLVEARLEPLVREYGLQSLADLVRRLRNPQCNGLAARVVEAMVTTETSFFRDQAPFATLRTAVLPELLRRRAAERSLAIWSAACSTGQEPYSIALLLAENFPELARWKVHLLASDLSRAVLGKAKLGRFSQLEVNRGLPAPLLVRHFARDGVHWVLDEAVRSKVHFFGMNLAEDWPPLPVMDVVFLRNVMIYFYEPTKKAILARVARVLRPDGYLVLGGAETTFHLDAGFARAPGDMPGFYQLAPRTP